MCSILDPLHDGSLLLHPDVLSGEPVHGLRSMLKPVVQTAKKVIADLSRVTFVDSAGCGVLLWVHTELKKLGGELVVCNVAPSVRALFELIRLPTVLRIVETREEALAAAS